jgi:NAD(P)H dehydrogenase (quinone)
MVAKRIYSKGGLVGKRALVTCTLGGRADMFGDDGIHGQINDMLKHLLQGTLGYTWHDCA